MPYLPVKDIDFSSPKTKKMDLCLSRVNSAMSTISVSKPTCFFLKLSNCGTCPAVLSSQKLTICTIKTFTANFKDTVITLNYWMLMSYDKAGIILTDDIAKCVETETRDHSISKLWYTYRAGRITTSKFKAVCKTDLSNLSESLS